MKTPAQIGYEMTFQALHALTGNAGPIPDHPSWADAPDDVKTWCDAIVQAVYAAQVKLLNAEAEIRVGAAASRPAGAHLCESFAITYNAREESISIMLQSRDKKIVASLVLTPDGIEAMLDGLKKNVALMATKMDLGSLKKMGVLVGIQATGFRVIREANHGVIAVSLDRDGDSVAVALLTDARAQIMVDGLNRAIAAKATARRVSN